MCTKRDVPSIWSYVIREEAKLRENGYETLTIGANNFNRLLGFALRNKAFKCLVVLMEFYNERLRGQDLGIDLVKLLARGITVYRAPASIISKLYKFILPSLRNEYPETTIKRQLSVEEARMMILAFCATKVTLIDVMPEIKDEPFSKHPKIKGKY